MNQKGLTARRIAEIGIVAAVYAVITYACAPLAYGMVQFRISEILVLLCLFKFDYCISMVIGCIAANIISSLGAVDMVFGSFATLLAVLCIYAVGKTALKGLPRYLLASAFPVVFNGVIVGLEMKFFVPDFADEPLILLMAWVALGEFVCVTLLGSAVFKLLEKNKAFIKLIGAEK